MSQKLAEVASLRNSAFDCLKKGDYPKAKKLFKQALTLDPNDIDSIEGIAEAYLYNDQYQKALGYLRQIPSCLLTASAHTKWGLVMQTLGNNTEAINHYKHALQLDPLHLVAACNLATVSFQTQRWQLADMASNLAIRISPISPHALHLRANFLTTTKNYAAAKLYYDLALGQCPLSNRDLYEEIIENLIENLLLHGHQKFRHRNYAEAIQLYSLVLDYNKHHTEALYQLGLCHSEGRHYEDALEYFTLLEYVVADDPFERADAKLQQAICWLNLNLVKRAWSTIQAAADLDPDEHEIKRAYDIIQATHEKQPELIRFRSSSCGFHRTPRNPRREAIIEEDSLRRCTK